MEKLSAGLWGREKGDEAQHIASGLEVPAAEPESSERSQAILEGHRGKEETGHSYSPQEPVSYHGLLPSAAPSAQTAETTSLSVILFSCDLNKALDGNKAVVFL